MSGGVWVASFVVLWAAVAVLLVAVLALVRQIGVLHARLDGVVDQVEEGVGGSGGGGAGAGEGPELGSEAPMPGRIGYARAPMTLVAFTSATCELSQALAPALRAVDRQYAELRVLDVPLGPRTISAFEAFNVTATPFVVAVDRSGRVRGRGRARNLAQLEDLVVRAASAAKAARAGRGERRSNGRPVASNGVVVPRSAPIDEPARPEPAVVSEPTPAPVETVVAPEAVEPVDVPGEVAVAAADAPVADAPVAEAPAPAPLPPAESFADSPEPTPVVAETVAVELPADEADVASSESDPARVGA